MNSSRTLGLVLIAPAMIIICLFFLMPVALTATFAFTNMSTATGISGGVYQVAPNSIDKLRTVLPEIADKLTESKYAVDEAGLEALQKAGVSANIIGELRASQMNVSFATRRDIERMLRAMTNRPGFDEVKQISELLTRSIVNVRFADRAALDSALNRLGLNLTDQQRQQIADATYSGWIWTSANFKRLFSSPDAARSLTNTLIYVCFVLVLFNTSYAMILALATHYLPTRPAGIFRAIWLLPRISPPVIYVLLWKWLAWDTGFISRVFQNFGYAPKNYMLDTATNAWVFVVLINGFVGASMGMLVFSSALKAIPQSQLYASEVDGAGRWQQIRHIILPQMRWPILFVTCYQTLSLLTSFDLILLSTNGGPGGRTEVWSLSTYHTALSNYAGNLEYGFGSAMALVLVVIGIVLAGAYLRIFNYGALVAKPQIEL